MLGSCIVTFALSALSLVPLAAAQTSNFTINPNEVAPGQRTAWCQAQINSCGTLCAGTTNKNDCDTTDLTFHCLCGNNSAPGLQYYTQTMPTFICQQAYQDCIAAHPNDAQGQKECTTDIQDNCGTLDPNKAQVGGGSSGSSSSGSSASTAASTSASAQGTSASASATATNSKNAAPTKVAALSNGAAAVAAGVLAALL
ncbi:hypothetical protein VTK73DRAFT_9297 [Phialemonium thermophilum]|uniref:DUF7707 domain-containing protein n=1 Tax=Phialemonium thermophilum TaxID=223376 RepID=A0ABR3XL13_9PEZI